jgi:hypothetical protein
MKNALLDCIHNQKLPFEAVLSKSGFGTENEGRTDLLRKQ